MLTGNPLGIHRHKSFDGSQTCGGLLSTNEHAAGNHKILDGGTLCKELRVAEDLEFVSGSGGKNSLDRLGGSNWNSRLLDDYLIRSSDLGDLTSTKLTVLDVRSKSRTNTGNLRWRIDADKNNIGCDDGLLDGCREK